MARWMTIADRLNGENDPIEDNPTPYRDCLILALRIMGEDEDRMSPECREVMERWRPKCMAVLQGACDPGPLSSDGIISEACIGAIALLEKIDRAASREKWKPGMAPLYSEVRELAGKAREIVTEIATKVEV